jgi:flagellar hook assembly protein FlgD
MRKLILSISIFSIFTTSAISAPFQPNTLKLTVPTSISYNFDGSGLSIPVTVSGTPADVSFMVFTKDQKSKISKITNGFLGWHYVNNIDTCLYMSATNQLEIGKNTILWNGKSKAGAQVPAGAYTYYMFGYDNKNPKVKMTQFMTTLPWLKGTILENDEKGLPMAKPIIYMGAVTRTTAETAVAQNCLKWIIGNDPEDGTLLETTKNMVFSDAGGLAFLPTDHNKYFHDSLKGTGVEIVRKFTWVPNGDAILDTNWGVNGEYTYTNTKPATRTYGPGVVSDGKDNLFLINADIKVGMESKLIIISANDGSEIRKLDLAKWWVNMAEGTVEAGGQYVGGPTEMNFRNGFIALGCIQSCINSVMDPYADTIDGAVLWVNRNGDIIGDKNNEPTVTHKWLCNDNNVGPYKYSTSMDDKGFVIFPSFDLGAVSFGLFAPDGTGIAYKAYAGENAQTKQGAEFIDYNSPYDGIYTSQTTATSTTTSVPPGIWFIAHDSIKGTISNNVGVEEAAPAAFSVAQNSPNPFNPATTISFTLAKTGKVMVDIYNAAGQKVDTLVNTTINAGNHSLIWNASKFSAGVYFYTVTSGDYSRTMKMTLLK